MNSVKNTSRHGMWVLPALEPKFADRRAAMAQLPGPLSTYDALTVVRKKEVVGQEPSPRRERNLMDVAAA